MSSQKKVKLILSLMLLSLMILVILSTYLTITINKRKAEIQRLNYQIEKQEETLNHYEHQEGQHQEIEVIE